MTFFEFILSPKRTTANIHPYIEQLTIEVSSDDRMECLGEISNFALELVHREGLTDELDLKILMKLDWNRKL